MKGGGGSSFRGPMFTLGPQPSGNPGEKWYGHAAETLSEYGGLTGPFMTVPHHEHGEPKYTYEGTQYEKQELSKAPHRMGGGGFDFMKKETSWKDDLKFN